MARSLSDVLKGASSEFVLVELTKEGVKPVYDGDGQLLCFRSGAEADREAKRLTEKLGNKVQPRRAVDEAWRSRETTKMTDGTYQTLPWANEPWWAELKTIHADHYPHVSLQKTALIAFTEDAQKGSADIQTAMKPGRYLERYFSTDAKGEPLLSKHIIRDLCCIFSKTYEDNKLQFADTPEDMEDVYVNGPSSCMSKEKSSYHTPVHPVAMYAAGDLQVAYMRREGRIVARSVVWPKKKIYNQIYGDAARLSTLLRKEGYKAEAPYGARLLKHKVKKDSGRYQYVCPHVDGIQWVQDDGGEFLLVGHNSRKDGEGLEVPGGAGWTEALGFKCEACERDCFTQRHVVGYYIGETNKSALMCNKCAPDRLVMSGIIGHFIEKSSAVEMADKQWGWTRWVREGKLVVCNGSGKFFQPKDAVVMPDGARWSPQYFQTHGKSCSYCGGGFARADKSCPRCNNGTLRSEVVVSRV